MRRIDPRYTIGQQINHWMILEWKGGRRRLYSCKCVCGRVGTVMEYSLMAGKSKSCGCRNGEDLSNQRFGNLVAIEPVIRGDGVHLWRCVCDCGKDALVRAQSLKEGLSTSCGCFGLERQREALRRFRKDPGMSSISVSYGSYKHSAKKRKLEFSITKAEFIEFVLKPCHYCGSEPTRFIKLYNKKLSAEGMDRSEIRINGIDRLDNSKGYVLGNMVTCCKTCNVAKHALSMEDFSAWVVRLIRHQTQTEGSIFSQATCRSAVA